MDPVYDGRTLTSWLNAREGPAAHNRAVMALTMLGTSAAPVLKSQLRAGSSIERRIWLELPSRWQARWKRQSQLFGARLRALESLENVPEVARELTDDLLLVLADRSHPLETRIRAYRALVFAHPESARLEPAFRALSREGGTVGAAAASWLAQRERKASELALKTYFETNGPGTGARGSDRPPLSEWRASVTGLGLDP